MAWLNVNWRTPGVVYVWLVVVLILISPYALASIITVDKFEDGNMIYQLELKKGQNYMSVLIPEGTKVKSATMNLEIGGNSQDEYASRISIEIDGDSNDEWSIGGVGIGQIGHQNVFSDGGRSANVTFEDEGWNSTVSFLMPKNVTITNAEIEFELGTKGWYNSSWKGRYALYINETNGVAQGSFVVDKWLDFSHATIRNATREIRITFYNDTKGCEEEVPMMVYNEVNTGTKCLEANVLFKTDPLDAYEKQIYYVYIDNPSVSNKSGMWTDFNPNVIKNRFLDASFENNNYQLVGPSSVAVSSDGRVFVVDRGNQRIQVFDNLTGLYIMTLGTTQTIGNDSRHFNYPYGVSIGIVGGSEKVLVADTYNHRVLIYNLNGELDRQIGITGESGIDSMHLNMPTQVIADLTGRIVICDYGNHRVQIYSSSGSYLKTLGVNGSAGRDLDKFNCPFGAAVDNSNRLYISDSGNHRIQIFDASQNYVGTIGSPVGMSGSGNQQFTYPYGLDVDGNNRLYVADSINHRVQVFSIGASSWDYLATIGMTAQSGSGNTHFNTPYGVAIGPDGKIYVADYSNFRIQVFNSDRMYYSTIGTIGQQVTGNEEFYYVHTVAVGGDRIVIDDAGNHRIQVFDLSGNYLFTIGTPGRIGTAYTHFYSPRGVAVGPDGRIYVSDTYNNRVQVFDQYGQYLKTIGTTGESGLDVNHLRGPRGIAVDANSNLYIADRDNHRIQVFNTSYEYVFTIGVNGSSGTDNEHLNKPYGVGVDNDGYIYVADSNNHRIQIFYPDGTYYMTLGTGKGTNSTSFNFPAAVSISPSGKIFVVDTDNHRVQIFNDLTDNVADATIGLTGVPGMENTNLRAPRGIAFGSDGKIYVADCDNHRVQVFYPNLTYYRTIGSVMKTRLDNSHLYSPRAVAVGLDGRIAVADTNNYRVQVFDYTGAHVLTIGISGESGNDQWHLDSPHGVAIDSEGKIYVADTYNNRVQIYDRNGVLVKTLGDPAGAVGNDSAHFSAPYDVCIGPDGRIYVADSANHRVQVFDSSYTYLTTIGETSKSGSDNSHFNDPRSVSSGPSGRIYVGDTSNHRIQVFDSNYNYLTTIGTTGQVGSDTKHLNLPKGVGESYDGSVYIADYGNQRVLKYTYSSGSYNFDRIIGVTGQIGSDYNHFNYPHGLAVGRDGKVYINDRDNHRIVKLVDVENALGQLETISIPRDVKVDVGNDGKVDLTKMGELTGKLMFNDATELKRVIDGNQQTIKDQYGNVFCRIPINITSKTKGEVSISRISIKYSYFVTIPDFSDALSAALKNSTAVEGKHKIYIFINSDSGGKVTASALSIVLEKKDDATIFSLLTGNTFLCLILLLVIVVVVAVGLGSRRKDTKKDMTSTPQYPQVIQAVHPSQPTGSWNQDMTQPNIQQQMYPTSASTLSSSWSDPGYPTQTNYPQYPQYVPTTPRYTQSQPQVFSSPRYQYGDVTESNEPEYPEVQIKTSHRRPMIINEPQKQIQAQQQVVVQEETKGITQEIKKEPEKVEPKVEEKEVEKKVFKCPRCSALVDKDGLCDTCDAKDAIIKAENVVAEVRSVVHEVGAAEEFLKQARNAAMSLDFKTAREKSQLAVQSAREIEKMYNQANNLIQDVQEQITQKEKEGCDISRARSSLYLAKSFLKSGNYSKAIEYARSAESRVKTAKPKEGGEGKQVEPAVVEGLAEGRSYLIKGDNLDRSFALFNEMLKRGSNGLCITRTYPQVLKDKYKIENAQIVWLTQTEVEAEKQTMPAPMGVFSVGLGGEAYQSDDRITPTNIVRLTSVIKGFVDKYDNSTVILEGIEYLIVQNDFKTILKFIQLLNEYIVVKKSRLIVPVDPSTMDVKELKLLEKEMNVI